MDNRTKADELNEKIMQVQAAVMDLAELTTVIADGLEARDSEGSDAVKSCLAVIRIGLLNIASEKIAELQEAADL